MKSIVPPWIIPDRTVVTVGLFDGVHKGHQALLVELTGCAKALSASPVVVTFDPHPDELVFGTSPLLVVSPEFRVRLIKSLGISLVWLVRLEKEFLSLTASDFLRCYLRNVLNAVGLVVGFNNRLGKDQVDFARLKDLGKKLGIEVFSCQPFLYEGRPVSSTLVRELILKGDLEKAQKLLGRRVSFIGKVVKGKGIGTGLGFPTANISVKSEAVVPCGVYKGEACVDNRTYSAAVNIGNRPTFHGNELAPAKGSYQEDKHVIEVHLLDYQGKVLNGELEVSLLEKLRDEKKFATKDELIKQIQKDVALIRGDINPKSL